MIIKGKERYSIEYLELREIMDKINLENFRELTGEEIATIAYLLGIVSVQRREGMQVAEIEDAYLLLEHQIGNKLIAR